MDGTETVAGSTGVSAAAGPSSRRSDPAASTDLGWALVAAAPDGILLVDAAGEIRHANPALETMLGYPAGSLVGRGVEELVPVGARAAHRDHRREYAAAPQARPMGVGRELSARRADGTDLPVEISLSPVDTRDGPAVIAVVRDISERLRTEETLRTTRDALLMVEERERIARDLHDTVIQRLFATGLLLQATVGAVPDRDTADRIEQAVEELDATIKDVRTAIFALHSDPGDGNSLRGAVLDLTRDARRSLGFTPRVRFDGPVESSCPGPVRDQLLPALREALTNVARHAEAGAVTVELAARGDTIRLRVTDDGIGLGAEPGHGDGLTNLAERATRLGGRCEVRSGADGGTVVEWEVPRPG